MKELKKELTLDPVIQVNHHLLNTLKIEIAYQNEGYSFATGEFHEKGIICMITPMEKSNNSYCVLHDGEIAHQGFYVFCLPCGRKSPKKMEKVAECILPLSDEIKDKFLNNNFGSIAMIINDAIKHLK